MKSIIGVRNNLLVPSKIKKVIEGYFSHFIRCCSTLFPCPIIGPIREDENLLEDFKININEF